MVAKVSSFCIFCSVVPRVDLTAAKVFSVFLACCYAIIRVFWVVAMALLRRFKYLLDLKNLLGCLGCCHGVDKVFCLLLFF